MATLLDPGPRPETFFTRVAERRRMEDLETPAVSLAFDRGGNSLAVALGDGSLRLFSRTDGFRLGRSVTAHKGQVLSMVPDIGAGAFLTGGDDGRVMSVSADGTASVLAELGRRWVEAVACTPTGGLRAAAAGKRVVLIDRKGAITGDGDDHPRSVTGLDFHPKGKRLAVIHGDGATLWWAASFGKAPKRLAAEGQLIGGRMSPDGDWLVAATGDSTLNAWRLADGHKLRMAGYDAKVRSLDFTPNGRMLATSGSGNAIIWSFAGRNGPEGKAPTELPQPYGTGVTAVAWHPKSPTLMIGYDHGMLIAVPGAGTGAPVTDPCGSPLISIGISPDGDFMAGVTESGRLAVIDMRARAG
ncbi:WD40 repeat domain-containing protein [Tistrella bauzanensis]|jgi:WD40 repeat protein|uniref:WD40 repeat domain-containing protein n=1 Tax=Tistrella arctica TaxID=3133430 RepID=A0ABU9YDQ2_9PROT